MRRRESIEGGEGEEGERGESTYQSQCVAGWIDRNHCTSYLFLCKIILIKFHCI